MGPGGKWIKLFLCSKEVASLTMDSLLLRIQERFPSLKRNTVNVKYHDVNDWIDLPSDDVDSFIDMIETAQQERENVKRITLQVSEVPFTPPNDARKSQRKRLRTSPSPTASQASAGSLLQNAKKRQKVTASTPRCLEEEFGSTIPVSFQYETPTQKFFQKLEDDKTQQLELVLRKEHELSELELSFKPFVVNKKPLCSNCHTPGHNKAMCSFAHCVSASICKDIKRHPDEEKHYKAIQSDLKTAKSKLKKLEEDIATKKESLASSLNTYATKVQADLINSNQMKYLRETTAGDKVPNWLIINTDIRKLERICQGKVPPKSQMQQLLKEYDENFCVTQTQTKPGHSTNPVKQLWEQKGICFPGKGVLPNRSERTSGTSGHVIYQAPTSTLVNTSISGCVPQVLFDEPATLEEERCHLEMGLKESLKTNPPSVAKQEVESDYGLTLLFEAAQLISD